MPVVQVVDILRSAPEAASAFQCMLSQLPDVEALLPKVAGLMQAMGALPCAQETALMMQQV